jgi:hypothetical protein
MQVVNKSTTASPFLHTSFLMLYRRARIAIHWLFLTKSDFACQKMARDNNKDGAKEKLFFNTRKEVCRKGDSVALFKMPHLNDNGSYLSLTGFRLLPQYWGWILGSFLRGCISLKNRSYHPLLRDSTSQVKSTCFLIRLK